MHSLMGSLAEVQNDDISAERLSEVTLARHEAGKVLVECLQMHRQVPVGIGSGSTGVEHKVKAMLHKLFWSRRRCHQSDEC